MLELPVDELSDLAFPEEELSMPITTKGLRTEKIYTEERGGFIAPIDWDEVHGQH